MVNLSVDNVEWLTQTYGEGTLSWALDGLLDAFRRTHIHTPQDYMNKGAEALKDLVEEK